MREIYTASALRKAMWAASIFTQALPIFPKRSGCGHLSDTRQNRARPDGGMRQKKALRIS